MNYVQNGSPTSERAVSSLTTAAPCRTFDERKGEPNYDKVAASSDSLRWSPSRRHHAAAEVVSAVAVSSVGPCSVQRARKMGGDFDGKKWESLRARFAELHRAAAQHKHGD